MTMPELPPALLEIARHACTSKQLEVIRLRETGMGWKRISLVLGVGPDVVREHHRRGVYNILKEVERVQALGGSAAGEAREGTCADGRGGAS